MNTQEKINLLLSKIKSIHIIDPKVGIWFLDAGYESFSDQMKKRNRAYEHIREIEYPWLNTDLSNGGIDEYKYYSENFHDDIYVYEIAHAAGDDVDFISYASISRLTDQEVYNLIKCEDDKLKKSFTVSYE